MQNVSEFLKESENKATKSEVLKHLKSLGIKTTSRPDLVRDTEDVGTNLELYTFETPIKDPDLGDIVEVCMLYFEDKKLTYFEFFVD